MNQTELTAMIKRVYIEITNVCNLKCAFCKKNTRSPRFMSTEEFRHILDEVSGITRYIYLHVQGEPLLHPQFDEFMNIAAEYGMQVQLVTNALLLKEHMDLLGSPALRKISFSLQSVEYHNADVKEFMTPLLTFINQASDAGRPYCELRFWRDDQMDLKRTKECLNILKQRYVFTQSGRVKNEKILPGVYVDYANPFAWPDPKETKASHSGTCLGGIEQLAILSDGTVVPCCLDAEGNIPLGNLSEESMSDILSKERYLALCEGFRSHRITEELCARCTFRKRFD